YAGQVVESGRAADIFFRPRHPYTSGLLGSIPNPANLADRRLVAIPGNIPAPGEWPAGCRFHNRCTHSDPQRCATASPDLLRIAPSHWSRCLRSDEITLRGVTVRDRA